VLQLYTGQWETEIYTAPCKDPLCACPALT